MIPSSKNRTETKLHESSDSTDDSDDGGVIGNVNNGPLVANPGQIGIDNDSEGNFRDDDVAGDEVANNDDNRPTDVNPGQGDMNSDGRGDVCQKSAFVRVDETSSEVVDLSDPIRLFNVMFHGIAVLLCFDSADTNDDSPTDMSDVILLLSYLILDGKASPPPRHPVSEFYPTFDDLLRCHGSLTYNSV